jgi:cytochrome c oxidase subunit II
VQIDLYERIWMWAGAGIIAMFLGVMIVPSFVMAINPPSHVETVDPTALSSHPEFATGGIATREDGTVVVSVVASTFAYGPDPIEVPAGKPIVFRITSADVLHGFQVAGTNANAMAIPGYVSQFTYTFPKAGEYVVTCNEYCGLYHHAMVGKLIVK